MEGGAVGHNFGRGLTCFSVLSGEDLNVKVYDVLILMTDAK